MVGLFDTFLRYKFISTEYPLYGITPDVGQIDAALNSALPTQENRVELGCTWTPTDCLMVNATLYVENAMSDAPYVAWTSNSLPFTVSAWWAPTQDWSFSAGAAEMDSWINQNITLSNLNVRATAPLCRCPGSIPAWPTCSTSAPRYAGHGETVVHGRVRVRAWHQFQLRPSSIRRSGRHDLPAAWRHPRPTTSASTRWSRCSRSAWSVGADYRLRPRVTDVRPLQLLRLPGRLRHDQRPGQHDPGRNEREVLNIVSIERRSGRRVRQQGFLLPHGAAAKRTKGQPR